MKNIELSVAEICTLIRVTLIELDKCRETLRYLNCGENTLYRQHMIHRTQSRIAELESIITKLEGCLYE